MDAACPKCGFAYAWNGATCGHCCFPLPPAPSPDLFVQGVVVWQPLLWLSGLLLAGFTGWYPADRWDRYYKETPDWFFAVGGGSALALGLVAIAKFRCSWWVKAILFALTVPAYLLVAAFVWFVTIMRSGFGQG
jgi:hypothetical protein